MKHILKKLTILSLLILFLPLFQTCSDQNIIHNAWLKNNPLTEKVKEENYKNGKPEFNLSFEELSDKKENAINTFLKSKKELTYNGFELGFIAFKSIEIKEISTYLFIPFMSILLIPFLLIICAFTKRYKAILVFSSINLLIMISLLLVLYFGKYLEDFEQIKVGYYSSLIITILIINQSYLEIKRPPNSQ